jgi:hypothetical protein
MLKLHSVCAVLALLAIPAFAADFTGSWQFSVDIDGGGHGEPVFVLKQASDKVTGTYSGPLGDALPVTGTGKGNTLVLELKAQVNDEAATITYTGTLDSPGKMHGTVAFSVGGSGKWTATPKK